MSMPTRRINAKSAPDPLALQFELPLFPPGDAPPPVRDERRRVIHLGSQILEYGLRRSRRRSIGFVVNEQGLCVTAPRWVTLSQIEEAIREKQRWILSKVTEMRARRRDLPRISWSDGAPLHYLGGQITLRVVRGLGQTGCAVRFDAACNELAIALPPEATIQQLKDRAQGWLQSEARRIFSARLDVYAARLGIRHRTFRLSSATTRWGSCSADGKILINWRLVHFPMSSIDYVVAHELAHLKEMNHGPRFWQTVAELFPEFESVRAQLQDPPPELLPVF